MKAGRKHKAKRRERNGRIHRESVAEVVSALRRGE